MSKTKLVILEGVDKVGKTSVYKALRKATEYGPLVVDRFIGSNFVYDCFWGREHYIQDYQSKERSLNNIFDVYLVYLVCSNKEHVKRLKSSDEDLNSAPIKRIKFVDKLFFLYYNLSNFRYKTIIDTAGISPEDVAEIIVKFMEDKKKADPPMLWAEEINKTKIGKSIMRVIKDWNRRK